MSIGGMSEWVTVVGGIPALAALFYPKIKKWAIRRGILYWHWKHLLMVMPQLEPVIAGRSKARRSIWYWQQRATFKSLKYIMPSREYVLLIPRYEAVAKELEDNSHGVLYTPTIDCDPQVVELAVFLDSYETDVVERNFLKRHKGVVCANGCGTKYGERRSDHDFMCNAGVNLSGGWFCPSQDEDGLGESCIPRATGEHYCGMCLKDSGAIDPPQIPLAWPKRF